MTYSFENGRHTYGRKPVRVLFTCMVEDGGCGCKTDWRADMDMKWGIIYGNPDRIAGIREWEKVKDTFKRLCPSCHVYRGFELPDSPRFRKTN